jgi:hypothetical protein
MQLLDSAQLPPYFNIKIAQYVKKFEKKTPSLSFEQKNSAPQKSLHVSSQDAFEKCDLLGDFTKRTKLKDPPTIQNSVILVLSWCCPPFHQICMTK